MEKKLEWSKPKLVVMARGRMEERTLEVCKTYVYGGPVGPEYGYNNCLIVGCATPCSVRAAS